MMSLSLSPIKPTSLIDLYDDAMREVSVTRPSLLDDPSPSLLDFPGGWDDPDYQRARAAWWDRHPGYRDAVDQVVFIRNAIEERLS